MLTVADVLLPPTPIPLAKVPRAPPTPTAPATAPRLTQGLEGLVESGMRVQRLLVNNMRPITADDARKLYQETM